MDFCEFEASYVYRVDFQDTQGSYMEISCLKTKQNLKKGVRTALAEDPGLVPSTCIVTQNQLSLTPIRRSDGIS